MGIAFQCLFQYHEDYIFLECQQARCCLLSFLTSKVHYYLWIPWAQRNWHWCVLWDALKPMQIHQKQKNSWSRKVVLLHKACAHVSSITHAKRAKFMSEQPDHLPYSPDMLPSDFHAFGLQKKHLKGQTSIWAMNSRTLWRHHYNHKNSGRTESFGSLINGIVMFRPMVHT